MGLLRLSHERPEVTPDVSVRETARIMSAATAGSVYASGLPRALAGTARLTFTSTGPHELKGFDEPMELFRVEERDPA